VLAPGEKLTPVPGLGDEAYFWLNALYVRRGHWQYHFTLVSGNPSDQQALFVSMAKALK
jgi:hypothetical protein